MTQPTPAQIEAGMDIVERLQSRSLMTPAYDAETMDLAKSEIERLRALTAAAQVGEPSNYWKECYKSVQPKLDEIEADTIERCAQVVKDAPVDQLGKISRVHILTALDKLKDAP